MKALLLERAGAWREMKIGEMEKPKPQAGEVLVRVHAVGLNPVDYKTGTNGHPNWTYPHILGLDVAGVVEEIGKGVSTWKEGDRIVYHGNLARKGGYAEYAVTTAHSISRIPDTISFEEAATLPCAGYTAYQALHRKLRVQEGESILIHGGAGGVGGFAVQLAALAGLRVITTASKHNHEFVRVLGAHYVIDYNTEDFIERVKEITDGRGVDAVIDTVSSENATRSLDSLAFNGRIAFIAGKPDYDVIKPFTKALSFHEVALGGAHLSGDIVAQRDLAIMGDELLTLVEQGEVDPMLSNIIALEDVPTTLQRLSERHVRGKIVAKL